MTTAAHSGSPPSPTGLWRRLPWAIAGVALATLLLSLGRLESVPGYVLGLLGILAGLAIWRPAQALLVLAGTVPIAAWAGRTVSPLVAWPEALAVAFLAGYCLRAAVSPPLGDRFSLPLQVMALLVAASLIVQLTALQWRVGTAAFQAALLQMVGLDYFLIRGTADAVDTAMRLLESLLLFRVASSLAQVSPAVVPRLAASFVLGAAAAAALNVWRLWEAAQRADAPLAAFAGHLARVRLNIHYGDLNAAGSFFALALIVAAGLAFKHRLWSLAIVPLAAGAWMTGSRAAFGAMLVAGLLPLGGLAWRLRTSRGGRTWMAAALLVLVAAAVTIVYLPERGAQARPGTALQIRWELARTSLRMFAAHPAFGVEVGEYYRRTGEFSSPELLEIFPAARNENAHNNFLQILAELGAVGLAGFLWLLGSAGTACVRRLREVPGDPLRWALVTGLLAFLLTWLAGHPLLIDEPAFLFWLLLGATAAWGMRPSGALPRSRHAGWVVAAAAIALAVTLPARAGRAKADADLDHVGIGLSVWQDELDGERYRVAGRASAVFLPAGVTVVRVPLRAVESGGELEVELRLDGRPADLVKVPGDRWLRLRLVLPKLREGPRFHRLDLLVRTARSPGEPLLMIGKVEPL